MSGLDCRHATTSTPGASLDGMAHAVWSPHEQELLNELLLEYPAEQSAPTERYIHIAAGIPNKTVRDVALRIRWMLQQQKQHFKAKEELPKKHSKTSRCAQASAGNMAFPDPPALMASPQHSMLYSLDLLPPVTGFRLLGMDDSPDFDHPQHDLELSLNALDLPTTNLPGLHLHTALARSSTPLPLLPTPTLHNMQGPTPPQPLLARAKHEGPIHAQLSLQLPSLPALNAAALPSPGKAGSTPGSSPALPPSFPCWPGGPHFPGLPGLAFRPTPSLQPEQEPQQQLSLREGVGGLQAEPGGPGMQPGAGAGAQPGSARAQGPGQGQADPDLRLPGLGQALLQGTGKLLHPDPDHSTGRGTALGLGGTSQAPQPGRPAGEPPGLDAGVKLEAAEGLASGQGGSVAAQLQGLLDSNAGLLAAFKANMAQCKVVENTGLLMQFRDTLMATLQVMNSSQGAMLNMPPLPVQLNLEQAARCLPPPRPPSMHPPSCPLPGPGPGTLSWPPAFPHLLPPGMPAMQGMGMLGLHPMQAMMMGGAMGLPPHGAASGMLGLGGPSLPGMTQPGLPMPPGPWLPPLAMLQGPLALGPLPELPVPPSAGPHQPGQQQQQQEGQQLCALPPPITLMPGPLLPCTSGGGSGDPGHVPSLATGSGSAGDFGAAGSGQASGSVATSRLHGSGAAAALTRPSSRCGSDQEVLKPGSARSGSSLDPFPGHDQPALTSVPRPVQPLALQQATPPAPAAALAAEHAPPAEQPLLCGPGSSPGEDTKGHGDKSSGSGLSMACSGGGSAQAAHLMHCSPDATPTTTAQPASAAPQAPQPPGPAPHPSAASRPGWVRSATASGSSREGAQQAAQPQPAQASGCLAAPVAQTATAPAGLQAAATAGGLTGTLGAGGTVLAASASVQMLEGGSLAAPAPAAGAPGGNPGAVMPGWLPGWPGQGGPHGAQGSAGHMFAGMHGAMAHAPMQHMMVSPLMQNSPMGMPGPWGPGMPMLPAFFPGQGSWMAMGPPGLGAPAEAAQPPAAQQQQQHMQMQQQQMQMQMQQQHMQMQHFAHMQQQQMQFQYHTHQMQFMQ